MEDTAVRRVDHHRAHFENRVRERDEADAERANPEIVVDIDHLDLDFIFQPLFGELVRDQPRGEAVRIERHTELGGEIGDGADMILMPVRQYDAEQVLLPVLDEFEVGHNDVDARIIVAAKGHAQIGHDPFAVAAIEIGVHADLARSAQREKKQLLARSRHIIGFR